MVKINLLINSASKYATNIMNTIIGTQLITSLTGEAVINARRVTRQADIIAAITLEVLKGTTRAFDKWVHDLRPHPGQSLVAETLRSLLHSEIFKSEIAESHRHVFNM